MNKSITLSLKKRCKLTKRYHSNPTLYNKGAVLKQAREVTSLITEANVRYIAKMRAKLDNPKTALTT